MRYRLIVAIAVESAYLLLRAWLQARVGGGAHELLLTGLRLATVAAYWMLFGGTLFKGMLAWPRPAPGLAAARRPGAVVSLCAGLAVLLLVPLLFGGGYQADPVFRWICAATSIVVGLREELLYRGVLQQLLQRRFGAPVALLGSGVVFVLYHYGAQPFTPAGVVELAAMSAVLGLLYQATGTLAPSIVLHVVYDALWSLGPLPAMPMNNGWRVPFHLLGLGLVAIWALSGPGRAARPGR